MGLKLSNNAAGRLSDGLSSSGTSIALVPGEGSRFPALGEDDYFPLVLIRASDGAIEITKATARSADVITIEREQENTTALTFVAGDRAELRITAGTMEAFREEVVTINEATHASPTKAIPDDADEIPITDSALSFSLARITFANLKAFLKTYFDSLYQAAGSYLSAGRITTSGLTQATGKLLGRTTASTGAIEEISVSGDLSLTGGVLSVSVPVTSVGGNTGAVTATQLLDAVKTVDGADSGLDADTLDGVHASGFATASHTHEYVSNTMTHNAVGSLCFVYFNTVMTNPISAGSTVAGSSIAAGVVTSADGPSKAAALGFESLTGTWRILGCLRASVSGDYKQATLAQRIA